MGSMTHRFFPEPEFVNGVFRSPRSALPLLQLLSQEVANSESEHAFHPLVAGKTVEICFAAPCFSWLRFADSTRGNHLWQQRN